MEVSFTKISDDILVPTHLYDAKDSMPLSAHKWEWWGFGGLWLFLVMVASKNGLHIITFQAIAIVSGILFAFAILFIIVMKLPFGWIELNRKDGTVTVWTSPKKRRRIAKGNFSDFRIDWTCRRVVTSKYSAQYRYSLGLYTKGEKKYKKVLLDGTHEVQFCFIYDMASHDTKVLAEKGIEENAERLTRKAESFLNDFFTGKPLPVKKNTFSFSA